MFGGKGQEYAVSKYSSDLQADISAEIWKFSTSSLVAKILFSFNS